jgi:hypothetical protein
MLVVDTKNQRIIDVMYPCESMRKFWECLLKHFGGIGGRRINSLLSFASKIAILVCHPSIMIRFINYIFSILKREPDRLALLITALNGQVGAFKIVMHNFIDAKELENPTDVTQSKLDACSFRGAIKVDGVWKAVPMCLTNAKYR